MLAFLSVLSELCGEKHRRCNNCALTRAQAFLRVLCDLCGKNIAFITIVAYPGMTMIEVFTSI